MLKRNSLVKWAIAATIILVTLQAPKTQTKTPQLGKASVKDVIGAMTREEKVTLVVGMGFTADIPGLPEPSEEDKKVPQKVPGAAGRTHAIPRLGIPSLTLSDGPAGVRIEPVRKNDPSKTYYATGFPIATLLASSWDTEVANRVGLAMGREVRDYGIDILLAPALNIQRNPLGGRNFEYYSEDPLIAGKMAAAFVKGVQANGVGTSIKHFAVNSQEFNRMQSNSVIGERALREIYLKGFEIAVKESQPWTVMSSYNLVNGTYTSQSTDLLTTLLRDEWGFKGLVMSDWFGGNDAATQLRAGNDLLMPGVVAQTAAILKALNDGSLTDEQLNKNVERVLNVILESPAFKSNNYSNQPNLTGSARVAREAATEGMVLLKNDNNVLPLAATKVALFGNASYDLIAGGTGSGDVNKKYIVSLDQGLTASGFTIDDEFKQTYMQFITDQKAKRPPTAPFMMPAPIAEMPVAKERLQQLAGNSALAVLTLGRNTGEFVDRKVEDDFMLTLAETTLLESVAEAFHAKGKKVIVVLNVGGPIEITSWRDKVDAVLVSWLPGQEGGHAITDVLTGKVNPSGKLATTFPVFYADVPSAKTFPGREIPGATPLIVNPFAGKPAEALYDEGIFVGYRYYKTFGVKTAYPFGYGLSYTNFSYGDLKLSSRKFQDKVMVDVAVTNSGKTPGKEVVQLYVSAPGKKWKNPVSELRAFAKTRLLKPGESQVMRFTLTGRDLASFDVKSSSWIAESGSYVIKVGASTGKIELEKDLVVEKSRKLLAPTSELKELESR